MLFFRHSKKLELLSYTSKVSEKALINKYRSGCLNIILSVLITFYYWLGEFFETKFSPGRLYTFYLNKSTQKIQIISLGKFISFLAPTKYFRIVYEAYEHINLKGIRMTIPIFEKYLLTKIRKIKLKNIKKYMLLSKRFILNNFQNKTLY